MAAVRSSHVPLNGWLATGAALPTDRHPWPLVVRCAEALLLDARAHLPRPESPLEASDRDQLQLISLHGPMAIELDLSGGAAGPVPTPEDPLAEAEAERARAESGDPDLQVIHILTQVLLAHPEFVPTETVRAAASLLDRGVERSAALVLRPGNEGRSFALHFLRGLFDVCDRPAQQRMHAGTASSVQHARCVVRSYKALRLIMLIYLCLSLYSLKSIENSMRAALNLTSLKTCYPYLIIHDTSYTHKKTYTHMEINAHRKWYGSSFPSSPPAAAASSRTTYGRTPPAPPPSPSAPGAPST